ncbi:MAG: hypothetical protein GYB25_07735 [Rhodobacteraceae bacterium]|nr:hypothetical protein [Paracoccaceae bacterium]
MILRDKPGVAQLFFAMRGSVLPVILPRIIGFALVSAAIVLVDTHIWALPHTNAAPFAVFGVALSLILGFRNNAAYERWWEARRLWGQLISDMRSLGREADLFIPQEQDRRRLLRLALTFIHLHRIQLRGIKNDISAKPWHEESFSDASHPPCAALSRMNEVIRDSGADGFGRRALAERLGYIAAAQAACERIATTPLPYVYSLLVFRTTYLYVLLIPLAMLDSAGWLTPLFVAIVAYMLLGLAEVTEELSHPFGETVNGLPLDALCRTVERSLAPHLDLEVPPSLQPENYYLS